MKNIIYIIICVLLLFGCKKKERVYYIEQGKGRVIAHIKPDCAKLTNGIYFTMEEFGIVGGFVACGGCMDEDEIEYFFNLPSLNEKRRAALQRVEEIEDSISDAWQPYCDSIDNVCDSIIEEHL